MTDNGTSDVVILKIFSGVQVGVEVTLVAGEYRLGSGPDDDIQLIDVSLKAGHARLRISPGKIELGGGSGGVATAAGVQIEPDEPWREIEPLDLVTVGSTRFALGHPTSRWASIAEAGSEQPARAVEPSAARGFGPPILRERARQLAVPLVALLVLLAGAAWFVLDGGGHRGPDPATGRIRELARVRETLDGFPFGRAVDARQEVDGTIYVNGYVETPVERRALVGALEATAIPARVRLWVLQTLRAELASLIESQRVTVTADLAPNGVATLDGTILSEARASRFVELVRDRVLGLAEVQSRIRTVATLLAEVEKLAATTQIQPWILLRADGELIEATGALPVAKVDAWVGFLQSYARRFSKDVALRSFVQLQNPAGRDRGAPQASRAIVVGVQPVDGDAALNLDRLRQGSFQLDEVFAGATPSTIAEAQRQGGGETAPPADQADRTPPAAAPPRRRDPPPGRDAEPSTAPVPPATAARAPAAGRETPDREIPLPLSARNGTPEDPAAAAAPPATAAVPDRGAPGGGAAGAGFAGVGAPGAAGAAGAGGAPGTGGAAGAAGPAGGAGTAGVPGVSGPPGAPGAPGAPAAGNPGADRAVATGPAPEATAGRAPAGASAGRAADPPGRPSEAAPGRAAELPNARPQPAPGPAPGPADPRQAPPANRASSTPEPNALARASAAAAERQDAPKDLTAGPSQAEAAGDDLAQQGRDVLERWQAGSLGTDPRGRALRVAIETLRVGAGTRMAVPDGRDLPPWYVPVLNGPRPDAGPACWPGAQLRASDIAASLFWLDILSASEGVTLATFKRDVQVVLLEAGLNPARLSSCAGSSPTAREAVANSLYLREIARNPSFVRFITRDLPPFVMDITGANLMEERFVLTRAGRKMYEGAAPDRSSRLALIGELGVAIQLSRSLAAVVYDPEMPWKITP